MGETTVLFLMIIILFIYAQVVWYMMMYQLDKLKERLRNCERQLRGVTESLHDTQKYVEIMDRSLEEIEQRCGCGRDET